MYNSYVYIQYSRSRVLGIINWIHVIRIYVPIVGLIALGVLVVQLLHTLYALRFDLQAFWLNEVPSIQLERVAVFDLGWQSFLVLALIIFVLKRTENAIYLVDFACFEPPESWRLSPAQIMDCLKAQQCFTQQSLDFMERMLERSGCGPKTAWPPAILKVCACLQACLPALPCLVIYFACTYFRLFYAGAQGGRTGHRHGGGQRGEQGEFHYYYCYYYYYYFCYSALYVDSYCNDYSTT
jgi:hypothetical protein